MSRQILRACRPTDLNNFARREKNHLNNVVMHRHTSLWFYVIIALAGAVKTYPLTRMHT